MATAKKTAKKVSVKLEDRVVVRTYSAGVHAGELVTRAGQEVTLRNARRIWRWRGANTLNEVATSGVSSAADGYTRVSEPVEQVVLTQAIEILSCSTAAWDRICAAGWAK